MLETSRRNRTVFAPLALLFIAGSLAGGCAKKDTSTAAPAAGQAASGVAPGMPKPTPEQEAARQRAIQQGPAIEAANNAAQGR